MLEQLMSFYLPPSKTKRMYDRRAAKWLCKRCGKDAEGFKRCVACRKDRGEKHRKRRDRKIADGVCRMCLSRPREEGKAHCAACIAGKKRSRYRLRDEVFAAYGGPVCTECGETRVECLQVDHVNNDGAKHRREIGRHSSALYAWLKKHEFPEGFQILCASCNIVKKVLGFVPPVKEHRRQGCHLQHKKPSK